MAFEKRKHFYKKPSGFSLCVLCGQPEKAAAHFEFPTDWFPISSAPKDGTDCFLLLADGSRRLGVWQQDLSGESCPPFAEWFYRGGIGGARLRPLNDLPVAWKPAADPSDAPDD